MASEKIIKQAGAIPWMLKDGQVEIVLVTARNQKRNWIVPKGHIDKGVSPDKAAEHEAFEEAGVTGKISEKKLGSLKYSKYGRKYKVDMYPMCVNNILDVWPEAHERERRIVTLPEALEMTDDETLNKLIKKISGLTPEMQ
ncbi:MAG: NUDIX hydrolase [Victivallaceae bacterium]